MTSSICDRLIQNVWCSFIYDLGNIPKAEGIYTIGLIQRGYGYEYVTYLYVGHSKDMHRRLPEHKWKTLDIDEFIKKQIQKNGGKDLLMKWVKDPNGRCNEGNYIECITRKLGYRPPFNKKGGNSCS